MSDEQEDSSSVGRGKRKSKPTSKRRAERQKAKAAYSKAREDAQLLGIIPTTHEGAIRPEQVNPTSQREPALPDIVRRALKEGWATPNSAKPAIVAALLEPFYNDELVVDGLTGKVHFVRPSPKLLNELAKTLRMLDQTQYERDFPEQAAKAKGGVTVNNSNTQNNISAAKLVREMIESGELGVIEEVPTSNLTSTSSSSGHEREVESSSSSEENEQRVSEGVENS